MTIFGRKPKKEPWEEKRYLKARHTAELLVGNKQLYEYEVHEKGGWKTIVKAHGYHLDTKDVYTFAVDTLLPREVVCASTEFYYEFNYRNHISTQKVATFIKPKRILRLPHA